MAPSPRYSSMKISALVSDVDGTLVTDDKTLTTRTRAAVAGLRANGITFSVVSSRPPRGLRALIEPLGITTPVAGFNGGVIASPDLSVIAAHLLSPGIARRAVDMLDARQVQVWVFSGLDWLLRNVEGSHVALEERTVGFRPTVVANFAHNLDAAGKIVGVSKVRRLQAGLQSFLSMRRIDARRKNASPLRLRFSQSLASLRQRLSQAMVRSTIQRLGSTANPLT